MGNAGQGGGGGDVGKAVGVCQTARSSATAKCLVGSGINPPNPAAAAACIRSAENDYNKCYTAAVLSGGGGGSTNGLGAAADHVGKYGGMIFRHSNGTFSDAVGNAVDYDGNTVSPGSSNDN